MPTIQIEINGSLREVSKKELFALAKNGEISPETPLHYDGKITVCRKAQGIVFAQASADNTTAPPDEFDHAQTMKPSRKNTGGDTIDTAVTMRPKTAPPLGDDLNSAMTMRPMVPPDEHKTNKPRSPSAAGELKRGDILDGKYQVIKKLGQGGMGAVYRVIDDTTDVEYAVKIVLPEYIEDPAALKELRSELAKAQSFTHQNLLSYKFFADTGAIKYIVMELVDGEDLEEYRLRKGGKLQEAEAKKIASQILNGLNYFHDKGLVHLDLKPQNIMVSKSGEVKITDYGISKSIKEQIEAGAQDAEMTAGTLCFMAPEQLNGSLCDRRTDIYALGLIFYQLLQGEFPFSLASKESIVAWHLDAQHICPPTGSSTFDQVIAKAISFDAKQRFTNCAEIVKNITAKKKKRTSSRSKNTPDFDQEVKRLIENGGDVNERIDKDGATRLHYAAEDNNVELLVALVKAGANVNTKDTALSQTPLHWAASNNSIEAIDSLVKAGADVNVRDRDGYTPLYSALYGTLFGNSYDALASGNAYDATAALIDAGADVNTKTANGDTPLVYTIISMLTASDDIYAYSNLTDSEMFEIVTCTVGALLSAGADVNIRDKDGLTALHHAVYLMGGDINIVSALIQGGADVNAKIQSTGVTSLHLAAECNAFLIVQALINAGADISVKNVNGGMPIDVAVQGNANETADVLVQAGAKRPVTVASTLSFLGGLLEIAATILSMIGLYHIFFGDRDSYR